MINRTQRVIWTALPTGMDGDFLTLTALASPRLNVLNAPIELLDKWPDFLIWAERIQAARFVVNFAGVSLEAERISQLNPAIWQALFTPQMVVHNYQFEEKRETRILSYPVANVHDFIGEVYGDLGLEAEDELPMKSDLLRPLIELAQPFDDNGDLQSTVLKLLSKESHPKGISGTRGAFILQEVYHMPLAARDTAAGKHVKFGPDDPHENAEWRQHRFTPLPGPMDFAEKIDFHATVSALNQYPQLIRLAGLAVDLRIKAGSVPSGPLTDQLSLQVNWKPSPETATGVKTLEDGSPKTITRRDDPFFAPVTKAVSMPLSNGLLDINEKKFRLIQLDVDGAGIKLRNTARSILRSTSGDKGDKESERDGLAALRTAGLQLVQLDRHLSLYDAFKRSGELNDALEDGYPIKLFAEDLIRGYHVDIIDQTIAGSWQSLCRRDGNYVLLNSGKTFRFEDEEGIIRLSAQEAADPTDPQFQDLVKISELVFSWSGWSLTAPRPELTIGTTDTPQTSENTAPPGLPLETSFRAHPGSLPVLRFGHEYRAKVRLVDLAGNALPHKDGDTSIPSVASNPQIFRRFEPVPPPDNALVEGPGGLERPNDGESMSRMAIRSLNANKADNKVRTLAEMRRHVVPPRTSHVMAEQHGLLDDRSGHPDPALYSMLVARDENLDGVDVLHEDPLTGSSDIIKYSFGAEEFKLPYLPDALARVASVRLDFDPKDRPTTRIEVPYFDGTKWPEASPFKIRIFEDAAATIKFDPTSRTLNVPLAKADMMRIRISHTLSTHDLKLMAVWDLMKRRPSMNPELEIKLRDMVLKGEHWMLTPWLEMELVHAVQKPLVRPAFLRLVATRAHIGEASATISYRSPIHAKSTDKIELLGRWREPSDIPEEGPPRVLNKSGLAFEKLLTRSDFPGGEIWAEGPHALGDTRYRRVTYRLEAPTRFREFMPPEIRRQPEAMKVISGDGIARIPNGSQPPAPRIVEITPTFGWSRSKRDGRVVSFRSGGGLRIWMERPWFSSGFGEMLGVLVASAGTSTEQIIGPQAKFVTQWGVDPIWRSGAINSSSPPVTAFPMRLVGGPIPSDRSPEFVPDEERDLPNPFKRLTNLELPESGGIHVDVAAHPVCYYPKRKLYYCDITVKPGSSYYPFIRFALARYHPVSTVGAHLSPAVIGDYVQLAPDRLLIMSKGDKTGTLKIQLFGHSYTRSPLNEERPHVDGRPVIRIEFQKKDPKLNGDIAWQRVEHSPIDPLIFHPIIVADKAPKMQIKIEDFKKMFSPYMIADLDVFMKLSPPLMWEISFRPPRMRAREEWRIMVMEYERHMVDDDRSPRDKGSPDPAMRLVYAEALILR